MLALSQEAEECGREQDEAFRALVEMRAETPAGAFVKMQAADELEGFVAEAAEPDNRLWLPAVLASVYADLERLSEN